MCASDRDTGCPGVGVTVGGELPDVDAEEQTKGLKRDASALNNILKTINKG